MYNKCKFDDGGNTDLGAFGACEQVLVGPD